MTATKTEPTDEQLKAYAERLPEIYKQVLAAFPDQSPDRRAGDGLAYESVDEYLVRSAPDWYRTQDLPKVLEQLERREFVKWHRYSDHPGVDFCTPTPLGERLITSLTGHRPTEREIPPLPEPTWG